MSKNNGKPSEAEFKRRAGGNLLRNWDAADLAGINGRPVADFPRHSDFMLLTRTGVTFAEVKSSLSRTSFPYANIEKGQRNAAALCAASGCGGSYTFYVNALALRVWFVLTADEFVADIKAGFKSRKWKDFRLWV